MRPGNPRSTGTAAGRDHDGFCKRARRESAAVPVDGCGAFGRSALEPLSLFQAGRAGRLYAAQAAAAARAVPVLLEPAAVGSGSDPAAYGRDAADLLRILHVSHTGCVSGVRAVAKAAGSRMGNFMVEPVCPAEWRLEILQ